MIQTGPYLHFSLQDLPEVMVLSFIDMRKRSYNQCTRRNFLQLLSSEPALSSSLRTFTQTFFHIKWSIRIPPIKRVLLAYSPFKLAQVNISKTPLTPWSSRIISDLTLHDARFDLLELHPKDLKSGIEVDSRHRRKVYFVWWGKT